MADPISAVASIAGLIDIAARTSSQALKLIDDWKDAPRQIYFLAEEMKMSQQIAQQLKYLCDALASQNVTQLHGFDTTLNVQLNRAKPVWVELRDILQSVKDPVKGKLCRSRWMRKASRVVSLQSKLRDIRLSTLEIVATYNA